MTWTALVAIGEICISVTAIVVASLRFAEWALTREDRLASAETPMSDAVRTMRKASLLREREIRQARIDSLVSGGHESLLPEQRVAMHRIDRELSDLDDYEYAAAWRGVNERSS